MKIRVGAVEVDLIDADDRIVAHLNAGHGFEPRSLEIWASLCSTRFGTVVDVGGYTGLFSIAAALIGRQVVAFEPMPRNAARFHENAERNNVRRRIQLIEAAVADRSGSTSIAYSPNVKGLTSGASLVRKTGSTLSVPVVSIDSLDIPLVAAIKIDVERGEPAVLRGARNTIERHKPALLVEVLDEIRKEQVRAELPGYAIVEEIDERNWFLLPK